MALRHFITQVSRNRFELGCLRIGGVSEENMLSGARLYHRSKMAQKQGKCVAAPRRKHKFRYGLGAGISRLCKMIKLLGDEGYGGPYGGDDFDDCIYVSDNEILYNEAIHSHEEVAAEHERWMARHKRVYKDEAEKAMRFEIFKESYAYIDRFNKKKGLNLPIGIYADLTTKEAFSPQPHIDNK